jgi:hypothetical protein
MIISEILFFKQNLRELTKTINQNIPQLFIFTRIFSEKGLCK